MLTPENQGRLIEVIAETLGLPEDAITPETSSQTEAAWTSFNHLTLMSAVEESFDIQLSMEEMTSAQNVAQLAQIVAQHL